MSLNALRVPALALMFGVLIAALPAVANADFPQQRLTHFGTDGDTTQQAGFVSAAYNSKTDQYLVVYQAGPTADEDHWAVYGQLVDSSGNPVGGQLNVSAPTSDFICSFEPPAVAYSEALNQFLVSWDGGANCDDAMYVQRLAGDGTPVGTPNQKISASGYSDIETSQPIYNPTANEWVVGWMGVGPTTTNQELFSQRLDANGNEVGDDDQKLTDFSANGSADDAMAVAVDPGTSRYLFVIRANDSTVTPNTEIYGHVMAADGATVGSDHFRISHAADTNASGNANPPNVVFDPSANRFLVAWTADEKTGTMVDNEFEVWARFVAPDASVLGAADLRYSDMGPDGVATFQPQRPRLGFNPVAKEFFAVWAGDDNTPPLVDNEGEVFGQRIASDGTELGDNDVRISHDGPDGDPAFAANRPSLAYNSSICRYLVAWSSGNVGNFGSSSANEDWDVYGNIVDSPCPPVNKTVPQISGTAQEGQTLTTSDGTWTGRGITFGYEWLRDGVGIAGATSKTYVPTAADVGHSVSSRVTATDPDGTASAGSAAVSPTAKPVSPVVVVIPKDTTPPVCRATLAKQKLGKVLKRGLRFTMSCNEAGRVRAVLVIPAKVVKTLKAARALTAGKATKATTKAGKFRMTIKLNKKAKKLLKKARSVKMTLQTTATDTAGNRAKKRSKSLKLTR
jgi:hypothetical protein